MKYIDRITDKLLNEKLKTFGGVLIVGPKGCGKTWSAKHFSKSYIEFQDEDKRENLLKIASIQPSRLLVGEKPILFDEWQDAYKIWGSIRKYIDDNSSIGDFILTGSTSKQIETPHTGTMRISRMKMYPMSLYETHESNGKVSLSDLFNGKFAPCESDLTYDELIYAICRGGWPKQFVIKDKKLKLNIAYDLVNQICEEDMSHIDGVKRNPSIVKKILKSYSRNLCTVCKNITIFNDLNESIDISLPTFNDYWEKLEQLFVIDELPPWSPQIRSKDAIRRSNKRNFIDPSIAIASLNIDPEQLSNDFQYLGFLFESLCFRDLKIYASALNGKISYFRDRYGLEVDCVLHLQNGKYALVECKLGSYEIHKAINNMNEIERLIDVYNSNKNNRVKIKKPDLKIVLTNTQFAYKDDDSNTYIIPIGCLKD